MSSTTITSKGQITLPKEVRDRLALKQGDRLEVTVGRNGVLMLAREKAPAVADAYGLLQHLGKSRRASVREMRTAVRKRARRKHAARRS